MTEAEAREALERWRENYAGRDALIRAANEAGVSKLQIHLITGLARTTVDRIIDRGNEDAADH